MLKCTRIDFGLGSAPDPAGEAHSAPQTPSWNKEDLLLRKGAGFREGKGRRERGKDGKGGEKRRG